MTSPTFAQSIASIARDGDVFSVEASPSWGQGRTLYGGMTTAIAWSVASQSNPDLPPLRSVQVAFVGPAGGRLRMHSSVLRRGRSATTVGVDVHSDDGLAARATFFCGAPRESAVKHQRVTPPQASAPDDYPPLVGGMQPAFVRHFDLRHVSGGVPMAGGPPEFNMWARMREATGCDPLAAMLAIADLLPPAAMPEFPRPGIISTLSWSFDLDRLPQASDGWFLCRSVAESTADGYSRQGMDLWDSAGNRLLAGRQTVAIFV